MIAENRKKWSSLLKDGRLISALILLSFIQAEDFSVRRYDAMALANFKTFFTQRKLGCEIVSIAVKVRRVHPVWQESISTFWWGWHPSLICHFRSKYQVPSNLQQLNFGTLWNWGLSKGKPTLAQVDFHSFLRLLYFYSSWIRNFNSEKNMIKEDALKSRKRRKRYSHSLGL